MRLAAPLPLWLMLVAASILLTAPPLWAQQLRTDVSAREVGVGETFRVELSTEIDEDGPTPRAPRLQLDGAADVHGPSLRTSYQVKMHNFDVQRSKRIVATWSVTPRAPGKLIVGPPSFRIGGRTVEGEQVVVRVSTDPPARRRRPDPFSTDPFSGDPFDFDPFDAWNRHLRSRSPGLPTAPEKLKLPSAPDDVAFLRAFVSDDSVVVGEPVTLEIYAYGSRGRFREVSPNEPPVPGFLSFPVVETSHEQPRYRVEIDGTEYTVLKLRETILVPLKSGQLPVGQMEVVLRGSGRGYPALGSQFGTKVQSQPLTVSVSEPPQHGRPDDYTLGDVGEFKLDARVTPRQVEQGDFIEVLVILRGRGHLPSAVLLPEIEGVVWEKPQVEGGTQVDSGKLGGRRTLRYTVQLNRAGRIDLGEARLPYYDPEARRYRLASADLGSVSVDEVDGPAQNAQAAGDDASQSSALQPRRQLGSVPLRFGAPPRLFWGAVLGAPLLALLVLLGQTGLRRLRPAFSGLKSSPQDSHLKEARRALKQEQTQDAIKAIERAIYEAIDRHVGLKARGLLRERVAEELKSRGVATSSAEQLGRILVEAEAGRFGGQSRMTTREMLDAASKLIGQLARRGKRKQKA